jgi:hypothetical protein
MTAVSGFEQQAFIYECGNPECLPVNGHPDNERCVISRNVAWVVKALQKARMEAVNL